MTTDDLIATLEKQAIEIAEEGHSGWGNTMRMAAERLTGLRAREAELVEALERWLDPYEGWSRHELEQLPRTLEKVDRTRAILARVRTEKGETT